MAASWQKVPIPALERVALASLAERQGQPETAVLAQLIREAVQRELGNLAHGEGHQRPPSNCDEAQP